MVEETEKREKEENTEPKKISNTMKKAEKRR
jgi:hypothetical protein